MSLFDCCVFSASLSLLTDARPQRKKTWWYAFTAAKAGSDSNAGRDGEATGVTDAGGTTHRSRPPPEVGEATGTCSVIF